MDEKESIKGLASIHWAKTVFWLGFWFLVIGGCTAQSIWGK